MSRQSDRNDNRDRRDFDRGEHRERDSRRNADHSGPPSKGPSKIDSRSPPDGAEK